MPNVPEKRVERYKAAYTKIPLYSCELSAPALLSWKPTCRKTNAQIERMNIGQVHERRSIHITIVKLT